MDKILFDKKELRFSIDIGQNDSPAVFIGKQCLAPSISRGKKAAIPVSDGALSLFENPGNHNNWNRLELN
jgi:hypothetical protein